MADKSPAASVETGSEMDYNEHERTYSLFLTIVKYTCLIVAGLLLAMLFGFFTSAGFFSSAILFILVCVAGYWILR